MLTALDNYDWAQVFELASANVSRAAGDADVGIGPFGREDVVGILEIEDGVNDEKNWELLCFLRDGRFAYITGGCDYTGWG